MGLWNGFGKVHTALYRLSGGRIGARLGSQSMLLLTTTGRRSGAPRVVALSYLQDGDDLVVVASNAGSDFDPAWWLNLKRRPEATVQVGSAVRPVVATLAGAPERARLWPQLKERNPFYRRYEQRTQREIPVVILRPAR
jgi:deazaflavin-dependent oxidoreductase (nitroreductase family)